MKFSVLLIFAIISWACGILFLSFFESAAFFILILAVVFWKSKSRKIVLIFILAFLLGFLRIFAVEYKHTDNDIPLNKAIFLSGVVYDEIDRRDEFIFAPVNVRKIKYDNVERNTDFNILIKTDPYFVLEYGDNIELKGFLTEPQDDGSGFSYKNYLKSKGIDFLMYSPKIYITPNKNSGSIFLKAIINLRRRILDSIENVFSEPFSSFIAGLLIGMRKGISPDIMQNFNKVGLTHILAISGWNITIIISFASGLFSFFGRRLKVLFSLISIFMFLLIVGFSPSVFRASIMGAIGLAAIFFGRQNSARTALFASGFIMTLLNPKILLFDVSFQLSFLSTAGLIYFMPVLLNLFRSLNEFFGIRDIFFSTISSQFFVMNIGIASFNRLAVIAPAANIFILPFIPLIMFFSFISAIIGIISVPLARILAIIPIMFSKFIFLISEIFSKFSFAYFDVYQIPKEFYILHFLIIFYFVCKTEVFDC